MSEALNRQRRQEGSSTRCAGLRCRPRHLECLWPRTGARTTSPIQPTITVFRAGRARRHQHRRHAHLPGELQQQQHRVGHRNRPGQPPGQLQQLRAPQRGHCCARQPHPVHHPQWPGAPRSARWRGCRSRALVPVSWACMMRVSPPCVSGREWQHCGMHQGTRFACMHGRFMAAQGAV